MKNQNKYYPLFMDLEGLPCLVAGGGKVAERKAAALIETGARVTVVSPALTPFLKRLEKKKRFRYLKARYQSRHAAGTRLIIGATGDPEVNRRIFQDAEKKGIPVNIVDQPELCRFIVPAVSRLRDIALAISTGGSSPGISAMMRRELEGHLLKKYAPLVDALKKIRPQLRGLSKAQKSRFWKRIKKALPVNAGPGRRSPGKILARWLAEITRGAK
jgi:siroheme synthase-like protein